MIIKKRENASIFYQILFTYSLWKCIETSFLYVGIRAQRVNMVTLVRRKKLFAGLPKEDSF